VTSPRKKDLVNPFPLLAEKRLKNDGTYWWSLADVCKAIADPGNVCQNSSGMGLIKNCKHPDRSKHLVPYRDDCRKECDAILVYATELSDYGIYCMDDLWKAHRMFILGERQ